jgi:transglutaminase-like putative cysteine protease
MTRRRWRITILAALATLAAVYPITSLFVSARWLPNAMLVIALTAALGLLLRGLTRSRMLIVLVQLVVVLYVVLLRFTGDTFSFGIPTAATVELANSLGLEAIETIQRNSAPAPLTDGVAFYLVAAVALIAVLVDAMAATWRAPAAAGLPLLTAYLITAANGNAASAVRYFIVPVVLWLIMLHTTARATFGRWSTTSVSDVTGGESSSDNASAMRALTGGAARLGALAVVAALIVPILVPHLPPRYLTDGLGRSPGSGGVGTVGFNDTIDLRNSLVNSDETPILRYTSTGPATVPLRALATSFYSRGEWRVAGRAGQGPDRPVPLPPQSDRREYIMTVSNNVLKAPRLAAPYPVVTPAIEGTPFRIDPVTRDVRVERTVDSYQVTYADVNPPVSKLRDAGLPTSADILADDRAIPEDAAELVRRWSDEVTAGATNDYDRAVAIQAHLRDTTQYTYSLDLGEPPTDDNGQELDPISAFYETRRGYCTQFATAMIMLARAQGIPARMAIGFIPGTRDGSSYIVRASDAHAWPELYFEGSGWLRFEPTASRSGPPAYSVPGQDSPTNGATTTAGAATGTATQTRSDRNIDEGDAGSSATTSWVDQWLTGTNLVLLITVLVVVLGTFLMPLTAWITRTLRRRRAATRQDLVEIEWDALMSHFDDLGLSAPPGATLRSARERYITDGHLDDAHASAMRRVTATLERARYDRPERTTPEQTEELHRDIRSIRRQVSGTRSWTTRVRSFLWPTEGVSVWRGLMSRLGRILRRRG